MQVSTFSPHRIRSAFEYEESFANFEQYLCPAGASAGDYDVTTVTVMSNNDATATDSADLSTTVAEELDEYDVFLPTVIR
ncbi:MAG: hypothetical protein GY797_32845 [Deltaproteobacteria bacterium]|nr:hypothetical protein [Deltaproteobacteria bacterium]